MLSKRQYQDDDFTPLLQRLRKKRRYFRKLIAHKKRPFTTQYLATVWEGHEENHLTLDVPQIRILIQEVQDEISKHKLECSRERFLELQGSLSSEGIEKACKEISKR